MARFGVRDDRIVHHVLRIFRKSYIIDKFAQL